MPINAPSLANLSLVEFGGRLRELKDSGLPFQIVLDGGVDYPVARQAAALGVDVLVTGIYMIFAQPDGIPGAVRRFNAEFPQ